MRHLVLALMLVTTAARADGKAIEASVKANVEGLARLSDDLGFTADADVVLADGEAGDIHQTDGCVKGLANAFYGCVQASITHKLGKVIAFADDKAGVGWFIAQFDATISPNDPEYDKEQTATFRVGGIARGDGELALAAYARTLGDAELMKGSTKLVTGAPALSGPKPLTAAVAAWFKSGLAGGASSNTARLIASGTSPSELASGAAALKLAKGWDKLKLQLGSVTAKQLGDKIGWVRATVVLPKKTGKDGVEMLLIAVVVPDGQTWRWVALQFVSPT